MVFRRSQTKRLHSVERRNGLAGSLISPRGIDHAEDIAIIEHSYKHRQDTGGLVLV